MRIRFIYYRNIHRNPMAEFFIKDPVKSAEAETQSYIESAAASTSISVQQNNLQHENQCKPSAACARRSTLKAYPSKIEALLPSVCDSKCKAMKKCCIAACTNGVGNLSFASAASVFTFCAHIAGRYTRRILSIQYSGPRNIEERMRVHGLFS